VGLVGELYRMFWEWVLIAGCSVAWGVSGRCVLCVWKVRFVCLEGAFYMSGRFVLCVWKVRFVCQEGAFCVSGRCVLCVLKVRFV